MKGQSKSLMIDLKKGNEQAYAHLVELYHHQLCVYANSLIHDNLAAEDIVQNVYFKIWKKRHMLKNNLSIKSYLYKSVYNEFIDQYRKNKSVLALEKKYIDTLDLVVDSNDDDYIRTMMGHLDVAIDSLPPKCKRVFILSKKEGLTNVEIAEHLNISKKSVEGQITKAFVILRNKLKDKFNVILVLLAGLDFKRKGLA
ncbi:RNA polymerase sigma-70 factor [Flagellimonas olearia]|uniref:RNA polymerase sigma-70 factor n=2 Tax=Flagellimonas olearia TaxID=552546 RepID=A0A6I1E2E1_9FLAO|nr:RNA polymerase sigma-70 factor [Allomuricauda olearia]